MMQKVVPQTDDALCAGGTLSLPKLTLAGRAWRIIEMALLYLGVPFAVNAPCTTAAFPSSLPCCRCWR